MRVLLVHNRYGRHSGEEAVVENLKSMLESHGHSIVLFFRDSADIARLSLGKAHAFCSGVYSFSSRNAIRRLLPKQRPDLVHIHNLFPLTSPAILPDCRRAGVPVVMTVHNYRLVCPNGLHMPKTTREVCERCCGGREYWCILRNCEASLPKSIGYALRNWVARKKRFFLDNVTMYMCLTAFQRGRLIAEGFPAERMVVVPNMAEYVDGSADAAARGEYVGYVGRVSPEKGVDTLVAAARRLKGIPFRAAGSVARMPSLPATATDNLAFVGHLQKAQLDSFHHGSRLLLVPSVCYEGFPSVIVEAMVRSKPIIASRIGGLPEIVDDGVTGLLFEPGNAEDLAEKIRYLWDRPDLCRQMGQAGREKVLRGYSPQRYYERLMGVYERAIALGAPRR